MSSVSEVCSKMSSECEELLKIVYKDHNTDPMATFTATKLSDNDILELSHSATVNEILKTSRGNGRGNQTISSGLTAFAEAPVVCNKDKEILITQQINAGNGFAYNAPSTWIQRASSDHMRHGKPIKVTDIFSDTICGQEVLAEPTKINLKPDWDPNNKNFLNGQEIDTFYGSVKLWSTKAYFAGSMITPLCDPRQISIIIQSGFGVIQSSFGLLPFQPGDLIQIPPHTPFCLYVKTGYVVRSINYYSKEDVVFPDKQLNVASLNQVPFSPSIVVQCKYPLNESSKYKYRGEYLRVEQSDGTYNLYYFNESKTAFNWSKWVHNGPIVHKVNLITNYERIGTNKGHKDPNLWVILAHTVDKSFGIAFITGKSIISIAESEGNKITYPPAYLHINGVHEKGETVLFGNQTGGYDARKGFNDGDCLLHTAGIGHGADKDIYKYFINKAIIKYILEHKNMNEIIKGLINKNKYNRFMAINKDKRNKRINGYIERMYRFDFEDKYDDTENVEFNVKKNINIGIDVILNDSIELNENNNYQTLGMPFGIGYLLVECRDSPIIPKPKYNSNFRKSTPISYGMELDTLVVDGNKYIKKINKGFIKSSL